MSGVPCLDQDEFRCGLRVNLQARFNDYIKWIVIIEKDFKEQEKLMKIVVNKLTEFDDSNDGLLAALFYLENVILKFEGSLIAIKKYQDAKKKK